MFLRTFIPLFNLLLTSYFALASTNPFSQMETSPNVRDLTPRATGLTATCNIYTATSATPNVPDNSYFVEIRFSGSWPAPAGLQSVLNTNLGSGNVIQFTSTATDARFFAPGRSGGNIVFWDSQISNSISTFSGQGVSVTCQYPGV